jgi:hypothetical protein
VQVTGHSPDIALPDDIDRQVQIVSTEHFVLSAQRNAMINEATGRATLFLTTVSMTMVALGFIAQATRLGPAFQVLAAVFLASLLLIGLITFLRALETGVEDVGLARRMIQVQRFYRAASPGTCLWLDARAADDEKGMGMGYLVVGNRFDLQILMTTASMVAAVDSVLFGALLGLGCVWLFGVSILMACSIGGAGFLVAGIGFYLFQKRVWAETDAEHERAQVGEGRLAGEDAEP